VSSWFAENMTLGYTVIAQAKAARLLEQMPLGETAKDVIGYGEGQLIETYKQIHGMLPPWNRMGGATVGRPRARRRMSMLDLATGPMDSLLVARTTIRQLAANSEAQRHEATIHAARIYAVIEAALSFDPMIDTGDVLRWLGELVREPEKYGIDVADHTALVASGYLMLDAPFS
jgi:hypothetical protein